MQVLDRLRDLFDAMAGSPFGPWLGLAALVTAVLFFITAAAREAVDKALSLRHSGRPRPLHLFDLSYGDAERAIVDKVAVAPERLWTYDEEYLDHFVKQSGAVSVGSRTALEAYRDTVLRWDIAFAVSMTAFIVLFWLDVATATWAPLWLARLAILAECMGVLYGFADVAEDVKLMAILGDGRAIVDPAEAAAANALTRVKFTAIALSVVGALMFAVLTVADRLLSRLFGVPAGIVQVITRLRRRLALARAG
jgi:hypothetical protein